MPNIGPVELVIILVILLLVIGPGRLPDVASAMGKSIREFRKAASDAQEAVSVTGTWAASDQAPGPAPAATASAPVQPAGMEEPSRFVDTAAPNVPAVAPVADATRQTIRRGTAGWSDSRGLDVPSAVGGDVTIAKRM